LVLLSSLCPAPPRDAPDPRQRDQHAGEDDDVAGVLLGRQLRPAELIGQVARHVEETACQHEDRPGTTWPRELAELGPEGRRDTNRVCGRHVRSITSYTYFY
jgi:hypothetical protein